MSLTWDLTKIKDYKELCWIPDTVEGNPEQVRINPVTESLIWTTITVGMGFIEEKNLDEFAYRLFFYEQAFGASLYREGKDRFITYEEIKAHIGLRTNVYPTETRAKWEKRMKDVWFREASGKAKLTMDKINKPHLELVK